MRENKKGRPFAFLGRKKFRIGGYALLITLLFIGIVVLVNIGVKAVEDNWALRLDLSYNSLTRVSDQTRTALRELDQDVKFYVLAGAGGEDPRMMEVLDRYRAASGHVSVQVIDPDKNPAVVGKFRDASSAQSFGANTVIVTNGDESRYKVYSYYDLVVMSINQNTQQYYISGYNFEKMFTQAMLYVTAEKTPTVYLLQGHGELPLAALGAMRMLLEDNNYDVQELGLTDEITAGRTDLLLILAPDKDLTDDERERIMAYLQDGGNMMYAGDAASANDLPNFSSLLSFYGVGLLDGMVVANPNDTAQYYPMQPTYLLPAIAGHAITAPLIEAKMDILVIPRVQAVSLPAMDRNDFTVTPLLASRAGSYLISLTDTARTSLAKQEGDIDGPFPIAVAVQRMDFANTDKESRVVLLGSTVAIIDGQMLNSFYNGEFLLSAVKWATKDEAVNLSIVSKTATRARFAISSASEFYTLAVISVGLLPVLVLIAGVVMWKRRRHL